MKKNYSLLFLLLSMFVFSGQDTSIPLVYISEYSEGSGNNRYLEIYNGQADSFDLSTLALAITVDSPEQIGNHELWVNFPSGSQIASGDVYIISHSGASSEILNKSDFTYDNLSDGNDGIKLVKGSESDYQVVDVLGDWQGDPGEGWNVGGVENGTKNHTLVRKPRHCFGEDDWTTSAGTNSENSEWFVYETDNWSNLGFHTSNCSTSDKLAPWKEDFPRNSDWENDWLLYSTGQGSSGFLSPTGGGAVIFLSSTSNGAPNASLNMISPVSNCTGLDKPILKYREYYSGTVAWEGISVHSVYISNNYNVTNYNTANWELLTSGSAPTGSRERQFSIPYTTKAVKFEMKINGPNVRGDGWGVGPVEITSEELLSINDIDFRDIEALYNSEKKTLAVNSSDKALKKIEIYNLLGQIIISKKLNTNSAKIDLNNLNKSIYIIKVVTDDNKTKTIKISIN